jgi:hypothetical protein
MSHILSAHVNEESSRDLVQKRVEILRSPKNKKRLQIRKKGIAVEGCNGNERNPRRGVAAVWIGPRAIVDRMAEEVCNNHV